MSTGDVGILVRANTLVVNARLGSLSLSDDSPTVTMDSDFKQILSIEGSNFADFSYQTFDPADKETYTGVRSMVKLAAGSVKVHYLEQPLHNIYLFLLKLAEFKGLYDAATEAAVQRASEIERMQFEISIQSPIVVFPQNAETSSDVLTLLLGQLSAKNHYDDLVNTTEASLTGIQLASKAFRGGQPSILKIVDDININAKVVQVGGINRDEVLDQPDTQVSDYTCDVIVLLTAVPAGRS